MGHLLPSVRLVQKSKVEVVEGIVSQGRAMEVYEMKRERTRSKTTKYMCYLYTYLTNPFHFLPTTHPTFPIHSLYLQSSFPTLLAQKQRIPLTQPMRIQKLQRLLPLLLNLLRRKRGALIFIPPQLQ